MAEFLLELFSEDIPARMQVRAAEDLQRIVTEKLTAAGLTFESVAAHSTPRRLALVVTGLPREQPTLREERKGPRVGAPQPAIDGFLRAAGVPSLASCEQRDSGKGVFWFAVTERPGRPTRDLLPQVIGEALLALPWPKSMRWAENAFRWVRPLHHVLAVFDGAVLAGGFDFGRGGAEPVAPGPAAAGSLPFTAITRGHRFLAPDPFPVASFADYRARLQDAFVLLDRAERKARIAAGAKALAEAEGLVVAPDDELLEEVAGLVEWPVPLIGTIDDRFMEVPPEVLITSMRTHQRYFATRRPDGSLAPRFIAVANMVTADGGAAVIAGNQRVLRARLSDARFFWDQDRKQPLRDHLGALKAVIFHARLGSISDKIIRLEALAGELSAVIPGCNGPLARHAAILSKTDLVTGMVGEFPELQGIMGRYYALAGGEAPAVADALAEHYRPLGPGDKCPTAPLSVALALADKVDTLVGFFGIGETPTGSKDPYALRRAALGVIRLVLENRLRLRLAVLFRLAHAMFRGPALAPAETVATQLMEFFADRLKVVLRDRGVRHDLIDAVFAQGGEDDLVRLLLRVQALQRFLASEDGADLLTAYRRASNIVRIEEKRDGTVYGGAPEPSRFAEAEETALGSALATAAGMAAAAREAEDFEGCMAALAQLRGPVDTFFERVTVNVPNPALRANRLRLLSQIRATLNGVADFSRIEG